MLFRSGHIWKFDPKSGKTAIFRSPSGMSNGIKFDARGDMLVCEGADFGGRRVTRTDMKTGMSYIVAAMYEGRPLNSPNDISIDERGRMYFSDPRYLGYEALDQPVMGVYRIDTDGSIHRIITDAGAKEVGLLATNPASGMIFGSACPPSRRKPSSRGGAVSCMLTNWGNALISADVPGGPDTTRSHCTPSSRTVTGGARMTPPVSNDQSS